MQKKEVAGPGFRIKKVLKVISQIRDFSFVTIKN